MTASSVRRMLALMAVIAVIAPAVTLAESSAPRLDVDGTDFVLATGDGRTLRGTDLVGATLEIGGVRSHVTIRSVEEDPHAVGGRVLLYRFVVKDEHDKFVDLCAPDSAGKSLGFPVPDGHGGFDLTCTSGAVGKCIRWGYRPWEEKSGGPPLRALHQACVRMVRADYGGDGQTTTRDGTQVYVCDRFGVRACAKRAPLVFEAAWSADGATCVARSRIPANVTLEQLRSRYPSLKGHLGHKVCTLESARRDPAALLFNRSAP